MNVYSFVMEIMQLLQMNKEQSRVVYAFRIVDFITNKSKMKIINSVHTNKINVQKQKMHIILIQKILIVKNVYHHVVRMNNNKIEFGMKNKMVINNV